MFGANGYTRMTIDGAESTGVVALGAKKASMQRDLIRVRLLEPVVGQAVGLS